MNPAVDFKINHPLMNPEKKESNKNTEEKKEKIKSVDEVKPASPAGDRYIEPPVTFFGKYADDDMLNYACNLIGVDSPEIMEEAFKKVFLGTDLSQRIINYDKIDENIDDITRAYNKQEAQVFSRMKDDINYANEFDQIEDDTMD